MHITNPSAINFDNITSTKKLIDQPVATNSNKLLSPASPLLELLPDRLENRNIKSLSDSKSFKQAIKEHDNKTLEELLTSRRISVHSRDKNGNTAYHLAVLANNIEALNILNEYQANIEQKNNEGKTPLMLAVIHHTESTCIDHLINLGANIDATDNNEHTAIYHAIKLEKLNIIEVLIANKADLTIKDYNDQVAIHHAIKNSQSAELITTVIKNCPDINAKDKNGCTVMHYAVILNKIALIEELFTQGADIDATNLCGQSAIHYAIKAENSSEMIKTLLKYRININALDNSSSTALHLAINTDTNNTDLIKTLIKSGINIALPNNQKFTALYNAILTKNLEVVNILVSHGADIFVEDSDHEIYYQLIFKLINQQLINSENNEINHLLYTDIFNNILFAFQLELDKPKDFLYAPIIYQILKLKLNSLLTWFYKSYEPKDIKPNFTTIDLNGWPPLHAAAGLKNFMIVEELIKLGADINSLDKNGRTILHFIARENEEKLLTFLLENKARTDIKDNQGYTALYYAVLAKNFLAIQLLLPHINIFITSNDKKNDSSILALLLNSIEEKLQTLNVDDSSINNDGKYHIIDNILKILLDTIAKYNDESKSVLHYIAELGLSTTLNRIILSLKKGCYFDFFNPQDKNGNLPLHLAAKNKKDSIIKALELFGSKIKRNTNGLTALHQAVKIENNEKAIELLLPNSNLKNQDNKGYTLLHSAIEANYANMDTITMLVKHGVDINTENADGDTAIHFAIIIKNIDALKVLIKCDKADINKQNKNGQTPLHLAIEHGLKDAVLLLDDKGADTTKKDNQGKNYFEDLIKMLAN